MPWYPVMLEIGLSDIDRLRRLASASRFASSFNPVAVDRQDARSSGSPVREREQILESRCRSRTCTKCSSP